MMRYNMVLVDILQIFLFFFLLFDLNGVYGKRLLLLHTTVQSDEMRYPAVGFCNGYYLPYNTRYQVVVT